MRLQHIGLDRLQGGARGAQLRHDLGTITALDDHLLDTLELACNAV